MPLFSSSLPSSLTNSTADHCSYVLAGLSSEEHSRPQRSQNHGARLAFQKSRRDHTTPLLLELHWLPVKYRIEYASFPLLPSITSTALYHLTCLPLLPPTTAPVLSGLAAKGTFHFPEQTPNPLASERSCSKSRLFGIRSQLTFATLTLSVPSKDNYK